MCFKLQPKENLFSMEKIDIINQIRAIRKKINDAPYGFERAGKTIPINVSSYARFIDDLVEKLIDLYNIDNQVISLNKIDNIRSIQQNEIREIRVTHAKKSYNSFINYVDKDFERISNMINFYIKEI